MGAEAPRGAHPLALLRYIPFYPRRVRCAGAAAEAVIALLARRPGIDVAAMAAADDKPADALILTGESLRAGDLTETLARAEHGLTRLGEIYAFAMSGGDPPRDAFAAAASELGWGRYALWEDESAGAWLGQFVRADYNPIALAGELLAAGRPQHAYEALERIPAACQQDADTICAVQTEMLLCLAAWARQGGPADRLACISRAQDHFYRATALQPRRHPAYQCQAALWEALGDADMAARLMRSALHAAPTPDLSTPPRAPAPEASGPPALAAPASPPRLLFVMPPRPHYGLDVVFDGLCRVLGPENVVDFPRKPSLHGEADGGAWEHLRHYPCQFDWPGATWPLDALIAALRAGDFDAVLYGDCERALDRGLVRRIAAAAGDTPLFLFDALDECADTRAETLAYLDRRDCAGYFKREMLRCADYGPNSHPLPFAYPDGLVGPAPTASRPHGVFWAGNRNYGLRRLYLEHLEAQGAAFDAYLPPEAYLGRLRESRVGLNFFGYGFDTVRYWELPAHGCMLLAESPPIRIPANFRDGREALFFSDLPELEERLEFCARNPRDTARIAAAGHAWLEQWHTGSARARQALAAMGFA